MPQNKVSFHQQVTSSPFSLEVIDTVANKSLNIGI